MQEAWSSPVGGADDGEVVVRAFNDMVSKGSLRTLRSGEWLGDEVRRQVSMFGGRRNSVVFELGSGQSLTVTLRIWLS